MHQLLGTVLVAARRGRGLRLLVLLLLVIGAVAVVVHLRERRRGGGADVEPPPPTTGPRPTPPVVAAPSGAETRDVDRPTRTRPGGAHLVVRARGLTKRYGETVAVDDLSFDVQPGRVTGFLGPNGAGKSTTMRLVMGLDAPSSGIVTIGGRPYHDLPAPLREVGALLEARAIHPGRRAVDHLWMLAQANEIPRRRVDEVLDLVGLHSVAGRRAGEFSLGMGQRLGIAAALLGDPGVVLFDEPMNGLDIDGIRWVRQLLRQLASRGARSSCPATS